MQRGDDGELTVRFALGIDDAERLAELMHRKASGRADMRPADASLARPVGARHPLLEEWTAWPRP